MATDYAKLTENLCRFYDFENKCVLFVGAAGRQLLDPAAGTRKLIAIDKDVEAVRALQATIEAKGLEHSMEAIGASFEEIELHGDVVYFEFCLHEMDDPGRSLRHAKSLAPDLVVYDHSVGSEWVYYCAEEAKVSRSSEAMEALGIRRRQTFCAEQRFGDYAELLAKVGGQVPLAVERAHVFVGATNIVIPMSYELNLL